MSQVYYVIYLYYLHVILLLYVLFCLKIIIRYIHAFLSILSSNKYDLLLFEREQQINNTWFTHGYLHFDSGALTNPIIIGIMMQMN